MLLDYGFRLADALNSELRGTSALLSGKRQLYELVPGHRPSSTFGQQIYDAAFGT